MIGLTLAAALQLSADPTGCHKIESSEITRLVAEIRATELAEYNDQTQKIMNLVEYWENACPSSRINLSKNDVIEISSLLKLRFTFLIPDMLVSVGKNLRYASGSVNSALKEEKAFQKARAKESPVWLGPPPRSLSLRCLQTKIRTRQKSERYCWTLQDLETPPADEDETGGPITFEVKVIDMKGKATK